MKRIYINSSKVLLLAVLAATLFSCEKDTKEPASTRQTIVKILDGGTPATVKKNPVSFVAVPVQILVVDLRRDCNDEAGLFTQMNVVVKDDTAAVKAANPNYLLFPDAWYTIQSDAPKVGGMGGTFSFVFKPSEFAKQIYITIPDATLMNPSALYAIGFTITSVDAGGVISYSKSVIIEIGAKNSFDGKYNITWTNYHPTANPGYTGASDAVELHTTGPNSCKTYWPAVPGYANPAILNGSLSYFGAQVAEYRIDPSTNVVTVQNVAAGAVTFYTMAVGFNSRYNVASKTIYAKWGYSYAVPGVFDAGCREWTQTLVYTGPR